jgi:hypothetical protein
MKRRFLLMLLGILFLRALPAGADSPDVSGMLGMNLGSALQAFGLPQSMYPFRGSAEERDDVVFYYPDHTYLFWYRDRVWQVRLDRRSTAVFHGVSPGMTRAQVETAVTERPLVPNGDSLYFDLDGEAFPVRVRLVFAGSELTDIYVYRSDF